MGHETTEKYTTADGLMEALRESGVTHIFANLGSDHPAIIESWAKSKVKGIAMPEIIICPHENVALSAAHSFAQVSGKAQAVLIHVDVGTQNLGGALHNASRGRAPVFIFAGKSPYTAEGELTGSRNEYIHYLQDVYDQAGTVREYVKWNYQIQSGKNVKQLVYRAMQIAHSDPKGPVYLMAAREVLEEEIDTSGIKTKGWKPIAPSALPPEGLTELAKELYHAEQPLIITSYLGRNPDAVNELVGLCDRMAVPVVEVNPYYVNFPADHPMHLGYRNQLNELVEKSDLIMVIDCDLPWIPSQIQLPDQCKIYYVDVDPLKERIPLWYLHSEMFFKADSHLALKQLNEYISAHALLIDQDKINARHRSIRQKHIQQRNEWKKAEQVKEDNLITPELLSAGIRNVIDNDTIIINEAISNTAAVLQHIPRTKPGTFFGSGGSSLGWNGGAAIGAKLASRHKMVVSLTGDGSYIFGVPTAVYWTSRKYQVPFLTVIYNNQGWKSPKNSLLWVHPNEYASQHDLFWSNFNPSADLAKVAEAAGGAYAQTVRYPEELHSALSNGINQVKNGRSAVIDVVLPPFSQQN